MRESILHLELLHRPRVQFRHSIHKKQFARFLSELEGGSFISNLDLAIRLLARHSRSFECEVFLLIFQQRF